MVIKKKKKKPTKAHTSAAAGTYRIYTFFKKQKRKSMKIAFLPKWQSSHAKLLLLRHTHEDVSPMSSNWSCAWLLPHVALTT